jgi:hypothetical protein
MNLSNNKIYFNPFSDQFRISCVVNNDFITKSDTFRCLEQLYDLLVTTACRIKGGRKVKQDYIENYESNCSLEFLSNLSPHDVFQVNYWFLFYPSSYDCTNWYIDSRQIIALSTFGFPQGKKLTNK